MRSRSDDFQNYHPYCVLACWELTIARKVQLANKEKAREIQSSILMIFKVSNHADSFSRHLLHPVAENQFSKFATSLTSKHPLACMVDECQKRQAVQKQENYCTVLLDRHHNKEEILTGPNSMRCSCIISQSCQKGDRLMSDRWLFHMWNNVVAPQ